MQSQPPTLDKIGKQLLGKINDLEKRLEELGDEKISEWDDAQGDVDVEKLELEERIISMEEQQIKILARYEKMRQTLSTVSEQCFGLKQKLRYHKSDAISNMIKALCMDTFPLPNDGEQLKEIAVALKVDNKIMEKKVPQEQIERNDRSRMVDAGGPEKKKAAPKGGGNMKIDFVENQNLILNGDEIIAGTIPQLLGCVLSKVNPDQTFTQDFLCTYHAFLSGALLLQNISQRFQSSGDKSQQLRVFNILKSWIQCNYLDIRDDVKLKEAMVEFIPTMSEIVAEKQTQMLLSILEKKINSVETEPRTYLIPKNKEWNLMKLDSGEIARQMTLHDSKLYRLIDPRVAMKAPEDLLITKRITKVEMWVDRELKKSKKKSLTIKKFVEIIEHCRRLRNFHSTFILLDAICKSSDADKKLVLKGIKKMTDLSTMTDPENEYKGYRTIINQKNLPTIPNFKLQTLKLLETKDEPETIGEQKLINFSKYRPVARAIQEIQFFQKVPYDKQVDLNPTIMGYIQDLP